MDSVLKLDEEACRQDLWPLTLVSPVGSLRFGILTVRERWEAVVSRLPVSVFDSAIPAHLLPGDPDRLTDATAEGLKAWGTSIERPWRIPSYNDRAIRLDFKLVTEGREGVPIPDWVKATSASSVFIEPGARLEHCILNASEGPVYIGRNAHVMDGACLRGPLAVCEGAVVKMGATLYGGTTVGPYCSVGGEVKNSVLMDFSNKAHHGYLGDSVVGRWCNLGAGTSGSNVRNNAGSVKIWNMRRECHEEGEAKCGLVMGDHSRSAIDTSFNTGTVVGFSANVFGGKGLTPKFVPSFSWGLEGGRYELEKVVRDIGNWMAFKGRNLDGESLARIEELYKSNRANP